MAITPLPTPPSRNDPTNFSTRADAFLGALPTFATEANALAVDVNADAVAAAAAVSDAEAAVVDAEAAAAAAAAAANVTKWVSGTTYAEGVAVWSPITYLSYRRKIAGAGTTDPSADSTNWAQAAGTGDVTLTGTQTLTNKTLTEPKIDLGGTNGTTGQAMLSQGAGLAPIWKTPPTLQRAPVGGGTLADANSQYWFVDNNANYVLPDLTGSSSFALFRPDSGGGTSRVTASDGWRLYFDGDKSMIAPTSTATAHGTWGNALQMPPVTAEPVVGNLSTIYSTLQLSPTLAIVAYGVPSFGSYVVAVDLSTGEFGTPVSFHSASIGGNFPCQLYAEDATRFAVAFDVNSGSFVVGSVSSLTITLGTASTAITGGAFDQNPIQLTPGLYAFGRSSATTTTTALIVASVSGTTITLGAAITGATVGRFNGLQIAKVSTSRFLVVYTTTGGGTASTRGLSARVCTVSGTTITLGTAVNAASNIYSQTLSNLTPVVVGSSYILCAIDGTTATTGNWHGITVSGTTPTIGTVNQRTSLVLDASAIDRQYIQANTTVWIYDSTTVLFGWQINGPFAVSISGTTLTFGAQLAFTGRTSFMQALDGSTDVYATKDNDSLVRLGVSGTTLTAVESLATSSPVTVIESSTVNNQAAKYSGVWYSWNLGTKMRALSRDCMFIEAVIFGLGGSTRVFITKGILS